MKYSFSESCKKHHNVIGKIVNWMTLDNIHDGAVIWCTRFYQSLSYKDSNRLQTTMANMNQELDKGGDSGFHHTIYIVEYIMKTIKPWSPEPTKDGFSQ